MDVSLDEYISRREYVQPRELRNVSRDYICTSFRFDVKNDDDSEEEEISEARNFKGSNAVINAFGTYPLDDSDTPQASAVGFGCADLRGKLKKPRFEGNRIEKNYNDTRKDANRKMWVGKVCTNMQEAANKTTKKPNPKNSESVATNNMVAKGLTALVQPLREGNVATQMNSSTLRNAVDNGRQASQTQQMTMMPLHINGFTAPQILYQGAAPNYVVMNPQVMPNGAQICYVQPPMAQAIPTSSQAMMYPTSANVAFSPTAGQPMVQSQLIPVRTSNGSIMWCAPVYSQNGAN